MRCIALGGLAFILLAAAHAPSVAWYKPSKEHEAAIARLMMDPGGAESELSNTPTGTEKLDYILYLHAFQPATPARDAKVRDLLTELSALVEAKGDYFGKGDFAIHPYDGTDASLVPSIQTASLSGVAEFSNPGYTIPCAVLRRRPDLLEAISPFYGSSGDGFLPYSGCGQRGDVMGFPEKAIWLYTRAVGYKGESEQGTIRVAYNKEIGLLNERIKLSPHYFLDAVYNPCGLPKMTKPVKALYLAARTDLTVYYTGLGLSKTQATLAATRGLRAVPTRDEC